jgi:uncharacterized protein (TIGR03083 family)
MTAFPLPPEQYLSALTDDSAALADAAEAAPEAAVESCPGWQMDDLVLHVGNLHRRVAAMVAATTPTRVSAADLPTPPAAGARVRWFREGAAALVAALNVAGVSRPCWTLDDPAGVSGFWFRRMAQETLMHRVDAELAAGRPIEIGAVIAADGIDETLSVHLRRRLQREPIEGLAAEALVTTTDGDSSWRVTLTPVAVQFDSTTTPTATVNGPAPALLCYLWNRGGSEALEFTGESTAFRQWATLVQM